jgi:2-oxoglutarate dehydrogenase E1 component
MQVVNLTTPAQIFHAMRRQMKRDFRKPLIVMSPKSLLRHARAVSSLEELGQGTFQEIIVDQADTKKVNTAVFVSGKLYYELLEEKEKQKKDNIVLIRMEQIYPFADKQIVAALKSFPNLKNLVWAQEEPKNMGAFQHVYFKFQDMFKRENLKWDLEYVGRPERSSPATGSVYRHKVEQNEFIQTVMKY